MTTKLALALVLTVSACSGASDELIDETATGESCPADNLTARQDVARLLVQLVGVRGPLINVDPGNLALLTTRKDCRELKKDIHRDFDVAGADSEFIATYYEVDGFFIAYLIHRAALEGRMRSKVRFLVYDETYTMVKAYLG